MPRNHSRRSTPARPSAPSQNQTRSASTMASQRPASNPPAPANNTAAAPPQPVIVGQQQGIMSQIATTAAGVAAGHVAGRMITGLFSGSSDAAESSQQQPAQQQFSSQAIGRDGNGLAQQCTDYFKMFQSCMDRNNNEYGMCSDYMEMMKSCQQQFASS